MNSQHHIGANLVAQHSSQYAVRWRDARNTSQKQGAEQRQQTVHMGCPLCLPISWTHKPNLCQYLFAQFHGRCENKRVGTLA